MSVCSGQHFVSSIDLTSYTLYLICDADSKFNPPEPFQFDRPNDWPDWKQRFKRYRIASKLTEESGEV
jgi:hypothetical protein